jgi:zinc protease
MSPALNAGLTPTRVALDNGIVVLVKATSTTPAVTIHLSMRAGSMCDPGEFPGAMYLLSRVIDRGTATRSADQIAEEFDSRGIALAINVTPHVMSIVCTCLAEDFESTLALLADVVTSPSCPEAEVATRKGEVITAIRQDEDNPAVRSVEGLMALLYGDGHPYGRGAKGSIKAIEAITREHVIQLHARHVAPAALTAVIVGDVEVTRALASAARVFDGWHARVAPPVPLPPVVPATGRRRLVIPMMNKAQADVAYGFTAIARSDPAYYAFWLMNNALGQYAIGGRLGESIRERQGMAYYVFSALDANVIEGPLLIRAGVSPVHVDRVIRSIDDELVRLTSEGLTPKELAESRQYLIGSMPRILETNAGIAGFLQTAEFFGLGLDFDVRLPQLLGSVTLEETLSAARRVLDPERATIVIAGPYLE